MFIGKLHVFAFAICAAGCSTYDTYKEPESIQPHAILKFEKAGRWLSSRPWPRRLNGAYPASTHKRTFRIHSGVMRLKVAAQPEEDFLFGPPPSPDYLCDITIEALPGKIYAVSMISEGDSLLYVVTEDSETEVAKCRAMWPDPIDRLMNRLDSSVSWQYGDFPRLDLPATATAEQLVAKLFGQETFNEGQVEKYEILMMRHRYIPFDSKDSYLIVLVDTNLGGKILLLAYRNPELGWWSRMFEEVPLT